MMNRNRIWKVNVGASASFMLMVLLLIFLLSISFATSVPSAPIVTYSSNTTYTSGLVNRSGDAKGTITTIVLTANQQDYKWKAYVGNVSGTLSLADATGKAVYDWSSGTPTGEVYVSRYSNINWGSIGCANQASIDTEQTALGMSTGIRDNLNNTFNATNHVSFLVGTANMSSCRSTATYINGAAQAMGASASFQEVLLRDTGNNNLVYAGLITDNTAGYNNQVYDFQLIIGENESSSTPTPYFFWVELG